MHDLWPPVTGARTILITHGRQRADDATFEAGFLFDFAQRRRFDGFSWIELALRERPVVVLRSMHEQDARHAPVTRINDEAARRDNFIHRFHISDSKP